MPMIPPRWAIKRTASDTDRAYWEQHAKRYDASTRLLRRPMSGMLALVVEAVRGRERVLELAAGTGIVTTAIATTASEVVATDYATAMIDLLELRVRNAGLANVRCEQADVNALRYPARSFDAVVAANVLHLLPDLEGAFAAFARMLRPGGILIVPTFCHAETILSGIVSRVLALTGFPGARRFSVRTLRDAATRGGVRVRRCETIGGVIPIGYLDGTFEEERDHP